MTAPAGRAKAGSSMKNKLFTKKNICTVPNLLTVVRLILIPFIIWVYIAKENYVLAVILIVASYVTDVADGYIARHFNQVSDLGKIIDPVADKLTEGAMLICLMSRYELMIWMVVIFAFSEILKAVEGLIVMKVDGSINGANWFGKVFTFMLYVTCIVLILVPDIDPTVANWMIIACMAACILTIGSYTFFYAKLLMKRKREGE